MSQAVKQYSLSALEIAAIQEWYQAALGEIGCKGACARTSDERAAERGLIERLGLHGHLSSDLCSWCGESPHTSECIMSDSK